MAGFLHDHNSLFRFISVLHFVGRSFLKLSAFTSVVRRYVYGEEEVVVSGKEVGVKRKNLEGDVEFVGESESFFYLFPHIGDVEHGFRDFHRFVINCGQPMGTLLVTEREVCRYCQKPLCVDANSHVVVIYHEQRGTYLGSRLTKCCRTCKVYEHYGYWTKNGKRQFDEHCLKQDFLLSSEDTAFDNSFLRHCGSLLVVGAVPFSTFTMAYNRKFGYNRGSGDGSEKSKEGPTVKRMKREYPSELKELLINRQMLDRRRLEEGFLLFASLEVLQKFDLQVDNISCNRNTLAEMVTGKFRDAFVRKWGDHVCPTPGCGSVLILDGNMKNSRQVCACRDVGELKFAGLEGSVVVGCQNTPAKGYRYCDSHKDVARNFVDDGISAEVAKETGDDENIGLLIVKILNEKTTRQGCLFEVLWSDGRKSWLKESNVPKKVLEVKNTGTKIHHTPVDVNEFGQKRRDLQFNQSGNTIMDDSATYTVKSSGFGVESPEDNTISSDDGSKRKLKCGTEKGRHKCKNYRTAGILVMERPCGIVVDVKEIFGSESKSQVYAHLHNLFEKPFMGTTATICYDDACHLKRFVQNPLRSMKTTVAQRLNQMEILCDRFHFKNHTDNWCRRHCNPAKSQNLQNVNTEVCEQLFSWLSKFSHITKHMNRWRFLFLMLYVLDSHNDDVMKE